MRLDRNDLRNLDKRYRATFVNSLAGVRPAVLVGTSSLAGKSNLAIFNSVIHIGADPGLWGLVFRPDTVRRDTLSNILETGNYTFNYVQSGHYREAHLTSAKFGEGVSEFEACGFTEEWQEGFSAPYVREAVVRVGLKFESRTDIPLNGTILIIGSICDITTRDEWVGADGFFNHAAADVLTCAGLDAYFSPKLLGRLSYARPGEPINDLPA